MRWSFIRKNQILVFLSHPFFLGAVIWFILYISFTPQFEKYQVRLIENVDSRLNEFFYQDIDGDDISEIIRIDSRDSMQTKVLVYKDRKILDQHNLHYRAVEGDYVLFFDYDRDKRKEIAVITQNADSIFLNIINPLLDDPLVITDRFIDLKGNTEFTTDSPFIVFIDDWGKKKADLFFAINTGHSKKPRRLYRYNVEKDSFIKSPRSATPVGRIELVDLDADSVREIIIQGMATGNFDKDYPYSDQFAWLMAFDRDLKFYFPPLKVGSYPSHLFAQPLFHQQDRYLAVFYDYIGTGKDSSALMIIDKNGQILAERRLTKEEYYENQIIGDMLHRPDKIYLLNNASGKISIFDFDLNLVKQLSIPELTVNRINMKIDNNWDGDPEIILLSGDNYLLVTDPDFDSFSKFEYPQGRYHPKISKVQMKGMENLLYLQFPDFGQIIQIVDNPLKIMQVPLMVISWLGISLIILGIYQIQRYRATRLREQEKRINTLQMRAIKNQLDPHFTFNIINAMGGLYLSKTNKETAYEIFIKYANLLRQTLVSSHQISVGLIDELEMVESYLEIEKLRKDYRFEYKLEIDKSVVKETKIPRMLIYTFVENAIKHGIRSANDHQAFIHINIRNEKKGLKITIENSGPGLDNCSSKTNGTGMGLNILKEIAELYKKLEGRKISIKMKNLFDDEGKIRGVQGIVFLS